MNTRIKKVLIDSKLTQVKFADTIGISRTGLQKLISGENNPREQTVRAICSEFGISRRWLETGEGEMYEESDKLTPEEVRMILRGSFSEEHIEWAISMLNQPIELLQGMTKMLKEQAERMNNKKTD